MNRAITRAQALLGVIAHTPLNRGIWYPFEGRHCTGTLGPRRRRDGTLTGSWNGLSVELWAGLFWPKPWTPTNGKQNLNVVSDTSAPVYLRCEETLYPRFPAWEAQADPSRPQPGRVLASPLPMPSAQEDAGASSCLADLAPSWFQPPR